MKKKVDAKAQAEDPKPRLWPFGNDDPAGKDADDAGKQENPPRLTPQHAGQHDPQQSRNKPDDADEERELECCRQRIGQKNVAGRDVKRAEQEIEEKPFPSCRAEGVDDLENSDD